MPDFERMYFHTFRNDLSVIEALENLAEQMKETQRETEEMYVVSGEKEDEAKLTAKEHPIAN